MKRAFVVLAAIYLIAALVGHGLEAAGVRRCGCADDCWCKRPGLSVFRWVFPRGHRGRFDAEEKRALDG
jgi:hypothetical protein